VAGKSDAGLSHRSFRGQWSLAATVDQFSNSRGRANRSVTSDSCVLRSPSTFTCPDSCRSRAFLGCTLLPRTLSLPAFPGTVACGGFAYRVVSGGVRFAFPRRESKYRQTPEIAMHGFEVEMHPTALLLTSVAVRDIAAKKRHPALSKCSAIAAKS
jgi:hypothetical protein